MQSVSVFPNITTVDNGVSTPIDIALARIQNGYYQDAVLPLRAIQDKEQRTIAKRNLPYMTVSGIFTHRSESGLKEASNLIAIDIDDIDPEAVKKMLRYDKYVFAAFVSCSGRGVCVLFKIDHRDHTILFNGIQQYLFEQYQIVVDPSGKDMSRPRYVSFDPGMFTNYACAEFKQHPKKIYSGKEPKELKHDVVFVPSDFDYILKQLSDNGADITDTYQRWLHIGFALADKFGEGGRQYYHRVSGVSGKYSASSCDRQFDNCLKAGKSGITIATFYYLCRESGIQTVSDEVRDITKLAAGHKAGKSTIDGSVKTIIERSDYKDADLVRDIVTQVFEKNVFVSDASPIDAAKIYVRNKDIRFNELLAQLEIGGTQMNDRQYNSLLLELVNNIRDLDLAKAKLVIGSNDVPAYHPIKDFLNQHKDDAKAGTIKELASTIKSTLPPWKVEKYLTKFLVGLFASLLSDDESHIMPILAGKPGTGKSYFLKRLLPKELLKYFVFKALVAPGQDSIKKDLNILFAESWLVVWDDMPELNERYSAEMRSVLSSGFTKERQAYGRFAELRKRICAFAGTSNKTQLIVDPELNRRIIVIEVLSIDQDKYNQLDKVGYLMEAYQLYRAGYNYRILDEDIQVLGEDMKKFAVVSELDNTLQNVFRQATQEEINYSQCLFLTSTQIANELGEVYIHQKFDAEKIGRRLAAKGFERKSRRIEGTQYPVYGWCLVKTKADSAAVVLGDQLTEAPATKYINKVVANAKIEWQEKIEAAKPKEENTWQPPSRRGWVPISQQIEEKRQADLLKPKRELPF